MKLSDGVYVLYRLTKDKLEAMYEKLPSRDSALGCPTR